MIAVSHQAGEELREPHVLVKMRSQTVAAEVA